MSFRLLVEPAAQDLLRSLAPHLVLQLGQELAALAESAASAGPLGLVSGRVEIGNVAALYDVDRATGTIRVTHLEVAAEVQPAASESAIA
jgi:hypothetical protein